MASTHCTSTVGHSLSVISVATAVIIVGNVKTQICTTKNYKSIFPQIRHFGRFRDFIIFLQSVGQWTYTTQDFESKSIEIICVTLKQLRRRKQPKQQNIFRNFIHSCENLNKCISAYCLPSSFQAKSHQYCWPNGPFDQHFLWDLNNTKWSNGFYIEFRQNFTKETFSYDEYLKRQNIQY